MSKGSSGVWTTVAGVAVVALATALVAGSFTFSQVAFDMSSRSARWMLATRNSTTLAMLPSGRARFGTNARLSLPLVTSGGDLRVSLRLVARVRGDIELAACGRVLGSARAPAGELARLIFDAASGGRCALDLGLMLRPDPFNRTGEIDSSYELERVGVRSTQGLRLLPAYAALIGCLPAALALAIGIAGAGTARPLLTALVVGTAALLWAGLDPIPAAAGAPWLAAASLLVAAGVRVRRRAGRIARRLLERADAVSDVSPEPRARSLTIIGLALVPALATCLWLQLLVGRGLLHHVPALNDSINYWLESAAFERAGWDGGYFTISEYAAKASFSRFGMHGPGFAVAYGGLGRIFGWHAWSAPVFNLALVTLALLAYGFEARPNTKACALASSALASFWPLPLFLPTNTQEGVHFAGAGLLAALLRPAFRAPLGRARVTSVVALVIALSLVKPIWGILWPPLFVLLVAHRSRRSQAFAFVTGLVLLVASVLVYGWLMAPHRDHAVSFVRFFQLGDSPAGLSKTLQRNLRNAVSGTGLELFQRAVSVLFVTVLLGSALTRRSAYERREALFHAWNLGVPFAATILVYAVGPWNDYRILAVHLLLSCLLLLTSPTRTFRRLVVAATAGQLAAAPLFAVAYREVVKPNYVVQPQVIEDFATAVRPVLAYRPELSGWCNTLLSMRFPYLYPEMLGLPRGFGVTMVWPPERGEAPRRVFRSAYVLIDARTEHPYWRGGVSISSQSDGSRRIAFGDWATFHAAPLAETAIGTLYRNLDSACPE